MGSALIRIEMGEEAAFPRFQEIINKYRDNFDGAPGNGDEVEDNGESGDEPQRSTEGVES